MNLKKFFNRRRLDLKKLDEKIDKKIDKLQALWQQGKTKLIQEEIEKLDKEKIKKKYRVKYQIWMGSVLFHKYQFQEAYEFFLKNLKKVKKHGNKKDIVNILLMKASSELQLGKKQEGFQSITEGFEVFNTITDLTIERYEKLEVIVLLYQASKDLAHENYDKVVEIYKKVYDKAKKYNCKASLEVLLGNLVEVYTIQGEYKLAFEKSEELLVISTELEHHYNLPLVLIMMGNIQRIRGNNEEALEYYKETLKIIEQTGWDIKTAETLYFIILLHLEMSNDHEVKNYLIRIEDLTKQKEDETIQKIYQVAKAVILNSSNRIVEKAEAQQILKKIYEEEIDTEFSISQVFTDAVLNLCSLLFEELRDTRNEQILNEIELLLANLDIISKKRCDYLLEVEINIIEAKIAFLKFDFDKAQKLLNQARILAEKKGIIKLAIKASNEHDELISQLDKMKDFEAKGLPLNERLDAINLEKSFTKIIQRKIEDVQEIPEKPVTLLILLDIGLTLFSHSFLEVVEIEDQLVGGFIAAIIAFCKEAFHSSGTLERIKHQDYTILIKEKDKLVYCYVYQGKSFSALDKLEQFIDDLSATENYEKLIKTAVHGMVDERMIDFKKLVESNF